MYSCKNTCYKSTSLKRPVPQPPTMYSPHKNTCYKSTSLKRPVSQTPNNVFTTQEVPLLQYYLPKETIPEPPNSVFHHKWITSVIRPPLCTDQFHNHAISITHVAFLLQEHLCKKTPSVKRPFFQPSHSALHYIWSKITSLRSLRPLPKPPIVLNMMKLKRHIWHVELTDLLWSDCQGLYVCLVIIFNNYIHEAGLI